MARADRTPPAEKRNNTLYAKIPATKATIAAPNTQTASYVQADVASLKTAIDAIRAQLTAAGITN